MRVLRGLSDRILPLLFWILLMLAFDTVAMTVLTLIAAVIHELGHIIAAMAIGIGDLSMPRAVLTGLRIMPSRLLSYREEVIVALGGPLINLLLFLVLLPFCNGSAYVLAFAVINLLTAVSNLIPIRGYDGHRILTGLLAGRMAPETVERVASVLTLSFSATAALLSLLLMMLIGEGYWIFAIFFAMTCKEIFKSHKKHKNEG